MNKTGLAVRQAWRRLASTPLASVGSVLVLALGIGCAAVMIDVLDRALLRPPAQVSDPDRVARVYVGTGRGGYMEIMGHAALDALAAMRQELESSAGYFEERLSLGRGQDARRVETVACGPDYFRVLGVQPLIGSFDGACAREDAAVISYGLWRDAFGGAEDVLGRPLRLGVDAYTIVAVAPRGFVGLGYRAADVWLPLAARAQASYGPEWKNGAFFLRAIARLRPGIERDAANGRGTAAYRAIATEPWAKSAVLALGDLRAGRAPGTRTGTRVEVLVAAMSVVVLLITCGNVANLMLVRGLRRERELAVKTALGASRGQLVREVLAEAALLAAAAGLLSLAVVSAGSMAVRQFFLAPVAAAASPMDGRMMLITALICLAAAFLLALAPALRLTKPRTLNPGHQPEGSRTRTLDLFAGAQVALSVPLIVAAALFVLSLWNARHQELGMSMDRVAVLTTNLFEDGRPLDNHAMHRLMEERVRRLPHVEATALAQSLPMRDAGSMLIDVPGKDQAALMADLPVANAVDPAFFVVLGMQLRGGRLFSDEENRKGARPVAVITESMARKVWPGEPAIGKCFYLGGRGDGAACTEVIGVIADPRLFPSVRPTDQWASAYFVPIEQAAFSSNRAVLVRTSGSPDDVLELLRREAQVAASGLPFVSARRLDEAFTTLLRPWQLGSVVFVAFGTLSVVIAGVGLVAVGAYAVTRRTREIGIRSALGAAPEQLIGLVLRRSTLVILGGLTLGAGIAWAGRRVLEAHLFDVTANDPRVLAATIVGVFAVGVIAAWIPARRAARIDPVAALRTTE